MPNRIAGSPVTLVAIDDAWRTIPEVPFSVQDAFGAKAEVVLYADRWRGLVDRQFAWLVDGKLSATAMTTDVRFGQTFESDAEGRALVIGDGGRSVFAVGLDGAATCLGQLVGDGKIATACWLHDGGFVLVVDSRLCVYGPDRIGRVAFDCVHGRAWGVRQLRDAGTDVLVLTTLSDDRGAVYAIAPSERVHVLADFDGLDIADVRLCLDETGRRSLVPDDDRVAFAGSLARFEGIADALARLDNFELLPTKQVDGLEPGDHRPAPTGAAAAITVTTTIAPDALVEPRLEQLGPLTAALVRMLRSAATRTTPDTALLKWIRPGMPTDLRAYVHAWAVYAPNHPTVYEFWMHEPKPETQPMVLDHTGEALRLGTFASGEPIAARLTGSGQSCNVVMVDDEGIPYRYYGLEGFLRDLRDRAPTDQPFELDSWLD